DRGEVVAALAPLADRVTTLATIAERAFGRTLAGDCRTPLAAYATERDGELWLRALIASRDGREVLRGERAGACPEETPAQALGEAIGSELLARGAAAILGRSA